MLDSSLTDVAVIVYTCLSGRSIDNELYLTVCYLVGNVWSALVYLEYTLDRDTCFLYHLIALACSDDAESELVEVLCYLNELRLVSVTNAEENSSLHRKSGLSSFLSLIVSLSECRSDTEDLTCRTHLRSEDRVYLLEHIEGEYSLLYAVMAYLTVMELRYWRGSACE